MKLLIYTPTINARDPIFGFMVRWLNEFREQTDGVTVLSRQVVREGLKGDIVTHEVGRAWLPRVWRIWKYAFLERNNYDKVFIHMSPEAAIAGFPVWKLFRKPVYLWYAHGAIPLALRIAEKMVRKIFASSPTGLRLKTPKATFVGQGIDVNLFKPDDTQKRNGLIAVSRIHPSKKYEDTLEFLARYAKKYPEDEWTYSVIGTSQGHEKYVNDLKRRASELGIGERFMIEGPKVWAELPGVYNKAVAFISTSETGSLDKVVLEALSCGTPVLAKGRGYQVLDGVTDLADETASVEKMHNLLSSPSTDMNARECIVRRHSLPRLVKIIVENLV